MSFIFVYLNCDIQNKMSFYVMRFVFVDTAFYNVNGSAGVFQSFN